MPQDDSDNEYEREENMMENITKTYLVTDTLITKLPVDFVFSTNKRYIEIQNCKVVDLVHNNAPNNVCMHINLLHDRQYLDNNVGLVNFIKTKYKRYEVKGNEEELIIWFTQQRDPPVRVGPTRILRQYNNMTPHEFENFDYTETPNYSDIKYLFDILKKIYKSELEEITDDYELSEASGLSYNIQEWIEDNSQIFKDTEYAEDLAPLFEDESFYTNDFIVDRAFLILQWCNDIIKQGIYTPVVSMMVYFFKHSFISTIYQFPIDVYPPTISACLAPFIYTGGFEDNENYRRTFKALKDYATVNLASLNPDDVLDFVMFIQCCILYKCTATYDRFNDFTKVWSMVLFVKYELKLSVDIDTMFELAVACYNLPDFTRASIDPLLDMINKKPSDFEVQFGGIILNLQRSHLFVELAHLSTGKFEQRPLEWSRATEYEQTQLPIVSTEYEWAIDPLYPEWRFAREVEYNNLNPFPEEQYVLNPDTNKKEAQYRFMAEFMLIF